MSGETDLIARHEQGDRVLSGGTDSSQLAETMERHAPEPEKTTEGPSAPGSAGGDGASPQAPALDDKPTRGRQRFADLTRERDEARGETAKERTAREAAEKRAADLEARLSQTAQPATQSAEPVKDEAKSDPKDPQPQEADFDTYAEFIDARARWNYREAKRDDAAAEAEAKRADSIRAAERATVEAFSAWETRRDAFMAKSPDKGARLMAFLEGSGLESGTPIGDAIIDSDVGPEIADYLASNPAEARRIAGLSPVSAIRALGRIESQLESPASPARAAWKPPAAPYVPVNGNSATTPTPSSELASKGHDFDASGYREKRAAERKRAGRSA